MIFQNVTKRGGLSLVVLAWAVLFSVFAWRSAFAVMQGGESWIGPIIWFSLLAVSYLIFSALVEHYEAILFFGFVAFSPSMLSVFTLLQGGALVIAMGLLFVGSRSMWKDFRSRIELSLYQSLKMGVFTFSLAVALVVSHGYYAVAMTASWEVLIPQFSLGTGSGDTVLRIAGVFYPELARVREENLTIDEFLADTERMRLAPGDAVASSDSLSGMVAVRRQDDIRSLSASGSLDAARGEFGKLVGRTISGNERTTAVFSEVLRNKLLTFLSAGKAEKNLPQSVLPAFLSVLVFFTVLSIAALLQILWLFVAVALLHGAIGIGLLSIRRIPAEREILA